MARAETDDPEEEDEEVDEEPDDEDIVDVDADLVTSGDEDGERFEEAPPSPRVLAQCQGAVQCARLSARDLVSGLVATGSPDASASLVGASLRQSGARAESVISALFLSCLLDELDDDVCDAMLHIADEVRDLEAPLAWFDMVADSDGPDERAWTYVDAAFGDVGRTGLLANPLVSVDRALDDFLRSAERFASEKRVLAEGVRAIVVNAAVKLRGSAGGPAAAE